MPDCGRIAPDAYLRWDVPLDCARAKPAGHGHHRKLEIDPTRHPGLLSLFRFPSCPVTDIGTLKKHESVHAIEDALLRIPHLQPVQLGQSGFGEPSRKLLVEVLPPVLVLYLKRFVYDASANGVVKINKAVQFAPELEIPPGTVFSFVFLVLAKTKNPSCLGRSRNHGAHFREICGACALQASWGALSPRRVRGQRKLYGRCAPPE
jgi:hypothetical protein